MNKREYHRLKSKEWREANPTQYHKRIKEWKAAHPQRSREISREYARRSRVGHGKDETAYAEVLRGDPCSYCGGPAGEVDHIDPLVHGGVNQWGNFTAACRHCNASKKDKSLLLYLVGSEDD